MMKRFLRIFYFGVGGILIAVLLLACFLLNPGLSYKLQTQIGQCKVYHNQALSPELPEIVEKSIGVIQKSTLYDPTARIDLCLNEGRIYPKVVSTLLGDDVIKSFSNKNVVLASTCASMQCLHWKNHAFQYSQFLSHVMVHNLQYRHHGFWDANPLGGHPEWKWEGYADFIAIGQYRDLVDLVGRYESGSKNPYEYLELGDGLGTLNLHIRFLLLTKYCMDVKGMDYQTFMENGQTEDEIYKDLIDWYQNIAPSKLH